MRLSTIEFETLAEALEADPSLRRAVSTLSKSKTTDWGDVENISLRLFGLIKSLPDGREWKRLLACIRNRARRSPGRGRKQGNRSHETIRV